MIAGCGDIGTCLAERLPSRFTVYGLRRTPPNDIAGITWLTGNLSEAETLKNLPTVDYLIYTATPDQRSEEGYKTTYLTGLKNCLAALNHTHLRRIFFISSTSVYGQQDGSWVNESSPTEPQNFSGKVLLTAEQWLKSHNVISTTIRFSGIYGPGRYRLLKKVDSSAATARKEPPYYTNRIHRDDCAGVLKHLIEKCDEGAPVASLYLASDSLPAPEWDVTQWLSQALEVNAPIPSTQMNSPLMNKRCDNSNLLQSGYTFKYPTYRCGYQELAKEYMKEKEKRWDIQ